MDVFRELSLLTDEEAIRLVQRIANDRTCGVLADWTVDLRQTLTNHFGVSSGPASGAVTARYALVMLGEDEPQTLVSYLQAGETEGILPSVGLVTAALVILQTEVTFEKDSSGNWSIKLHKRSASDELLKSFVKAILRLG